MTKILRGRPLWLERKMDTHVKTFMEATLQTYITSLQDHVFR